jgi:hypothetical protein
MIIMVALVTATACSDLEPELDGGLGAHQRHDAVRAALQLDLRHQALHAHGGDEADEAVARAAHDVAGIRPARERLGALGELGPARPGVLSRRADSVDPVVAPSGARCHRSLEEGSRPRGSENAS